MSKFELPPLTQQAIMHVDATPDEGYPLRILRAYRENCNCRWATTTDGAMDALCGMMNEMCDKRAAILDKAIARLEAKG
jgi:hypothetical protein